MTTNYMLADMLTRIRNGQRAKIKSIKQPKSILCLRVLEVLVDEGVVQNFRSEPENPYFVEVLLKYYEGRPVIQEITCVSKTRSTCLHWCEKLVAPSTWAWFLYFQPLKVFFQIVKLERITLAEKFYARLFKKLK